LYHSSGKVHFEPEDFEEAVQDFGVHFSLTNPISKTEEYSLVALYRGGLPLGVRLSNQFNLTLSIVDYQRLDGDSSEPAFIKNIVKSDNIILVDDIADEGITISRTLEFLKKEFPKKEILVYTIFGNNKKHPSGWKYTFLHHKEWIQFVPWEGK